jgi:diguanylate cyclase
MKKTILHLDDEPELRSWLRAELLSAGYDAYCFESKFTGYLWSIANHPDLILSDIKSPEPDGIEFIKMIRSTNATKDIPFIFVTGFSDLKMAVESVKLGSNDFVSKPFNVTDLLESIERLLGANSYKTSS